MTVEPVWNSVLKRLQNRELVLPIYENQLRADDWPDNYTITVDSRPHTIRPVEDRCFYPSSHPLAPARYLYYFMHPGYCDQLVPEPFSLSSKMSMDMGSALHAIVQTQMLMAGLVREKNIEKLFVDPVHHIRGRIDMIVDHPSEGPLVTEIKSRNPRLFDKTTEPTPSWEAQVSIQLDNEGAERGLVLMIEMGYPWRSRELSVHRNNQLLDTIYSKFDSVREAVAADAQPPRECCGMGSPEAQRCPARFLCGVS